MALLVLMLSMNLVGTADTVASAPDNYVGVESVERPTHHVNAIWPCEYFKPHTGDDLFFWAWNNESNPYVDTADCAYDHPTGGQHLRCIIEWHHHGNGRPINPPGYTWQNGWC